MIEWQFHNCTFQCSKLKFLGYSALKNWKTARTSWKVAVKLSWSWFPANFFDFRLTSTSPWLVGLPEKKSFGRLPRTMTKLAHSMHPAIVRHTCLNIPKQGTSISISVNALIWLENMQYGLSHASFCVAGKIMNERSVFSRQRIASEPLFCALLAPAYVLRRLFGFPSCISELCKVKSLASLWTNSPPAKKTNPLRVFFWCLCGPWDMLHVSDLTFHICILSCRESSMSNFHTISLYYRARRR